MVSFKEVFNKISYKLLIILIVILCFALVLAVFLFLEEGIEGGLEGELKTLKWGADEAEQIILEIENYELLNDNQTIMVSIYRGAGGGDLGAILIVFNRSEGACNYTIYDNLPYGLNTKVYSIEASETNCEPNNFTNITNISDMELYAGINIYKEVIFPENCSFESLNETWDSIFTEPAENLNIVTDPDYKPYGDNYGYVNRSCPLFFMYTIDGSDVSVIYGKMINQTAQKWVGKEVYALKGDVVDGVITNIFDVSESNIGEGEYIIDSLKTWGGAQGEREIKDDTEAVRKFEETFFIEVPYSDMLSSVRGYDGVDMIYYRFGVSGWIYGEKDIYNFKEGEILKEKEMDYFAQEVIEAEKANLTLIKDFDEIKVYRDEGNTTDLIYLDEYFSCLIDDLRIYIYYDDYGQTSNITFYQNYSDNGVIFYIPSGEYGRQKFEVRAYCGHHDSLNKYSDGYENKLTFNVSFLDETKLVNDSGNHAPVFLEEDCGYFVVYKNMNQSIDMGYCFDDEDDDELNFTYTEMNIDEIGIERDGDDLKFVPEKDFLGKGYFYIYANDSIEKIRSTKIYIEVEEPSSANGDDGNGGNGDDDGNGDDGGESVGDDGENPRIVSSSPPGAEVKILLNRSQAFSISAENYESIRWYVDGDLVKSGVDSYEVGDLDEGDYEIRVEVKKGDEVVSKIWNLVVSKKSDRTIYFVVICVILGVFILLVVLLIVKAILERKEEKRTNPIIRLKSRSILDAFQSR